MIQLAQSNGTHLALGEQYICQLGTQNKPNLDWDLGSRLVYNCLGDALDINKNGLKLNKKNTFKYFICTNWINWNENSSYACLGIGHRYNEQLKQV